MRDTVIITEELVDAMREFITDRRDVDAYEWDRRAVLSTIEEHYRGGIARFAHKYGFATIRPFFGSEGVAS